MKKIKVSTSRITINHFLILGLAILIGVQVYISNQIATTGELLNQLEQQAVVLEEENRHLLSENVAYMSLQKLTQKAKQLGYVEPEQVLNLESGSDQLALKP